MAVVSLPELKCFAPVLLATPLLRWGLLYKAPTCGAFLLRFLNGIGFVVCLFLAALRSGRKVYFYFGLRRLCLSPEYVEKGSSRDVTSRGCRTRRSAFKGTLCVPFVCEK